MALAKLKYCQGTLTPGQFWARTGMPEASLLYAHIVENSILYHFKRVVFPFDQIIDFSQC